MAHMARPFDPLWGEHAEESTRLFFEYLDPLKADQPANAVIGAHYFLQRYEANPAAYTAITGQEFGERYAHGILNVVAAARATRDSVTHEERDALLVPYYASWNNPEYVWQRLWEGEPQLHQAYCERYAFERAHEAIQAAAGALEVMQQEDQQQQQQRLTQEEGQEADEQPREPPGRPWTPPVGNGEDPGAQ